MGFFGDVMLKIGICSFGAHVVKVSLGSLKTVSEAVL